MLADPGVDLVEGLPPPHDVPARRGAPGGGGDGICLEVGENGGRGRFPVKCGGPVPMHGADGGILLMTRTDSGMREGKGMGVLCPVCASCAVCTHGRRDHPGGDWAKQPRYLACKRRLEMLSGFFGEIFTDDDDNSQRKVAETIEKCGRKKMVKVMTTFPDKKVCSANCHPVVPCLSASSSAAVCMVRFGARPAAVKLCSPLKM